jgi:uncharacterized protein
MLEDSTPQIRAESIARVFIRPMHAAGWAGLVLAGIAAYAGLAFLLEDAEHRPKLPMLRRGAARASLEADLIDHLRRLESEPGVRRSL